MTDRMMAAIEALKNGEEIVVDEPGADLETPEVGEDVSEETSGDEELDQEDLVESTEAEGDVDEEAQAGEPEPESTDKSPELTEITNKAKAFEKGMRKFQRERDEARRELEKFKPLQEKAANYDKLDEIYQTRGVSGVIEQLEGKTLDEIVDARIERLILEREKPEEAARLKHQEELEAERRQRELLEKRMEDQLKKTEAEREAAEQTKLEGLIQPVFTRYSFSGKLGDETAEHQMDEALWNQALNRLEALPDDVELTPAIVRREFRAVANGFSKIIQRQVAETSQKVSRAKKAAAKENVQAAAASGIAGNKSREDVIKKVRSGNLTESLTDILMGKLKL